MSEEEFGDEGTVVLHAHDVVSHSSGERMSFRK